MENVEIIILSPNQWEDYKNFRLKALKENPEAFGQSYDKAIVRSDDEWRILLEKSADNQKRWVFFAKLNGELVGMVSGTAMQSIAGAVKVQEMFVAKEVRRKGVAKKLIQRLVEELIEHTDKRILRLGVFKTQKEAINLYKSLGFEIIEEKTEHLPDRRSPQSLIMEKRLK